VGYVVYHCYLRFVSGVGCVAVVALTNLKYQW
jgi:hypothetical protein